MKPENPVLEPSLFEVRPLLAKPYILCDYHFICLLCLRVYWGFISVSQLIITTCDVSLWSQGQELKQNV